MHIIKMTVTAFADKKKCALISYEKPTVSLGFDTLTHSLTHSLTYFVSILPKCACYLPPEWTLPHWIQVDLQQYSAVTGVVIRKRCDPYSYQYVRSYEIQVRRGSNWRTIYTAVRCNNLCNTRVFVPVFVPFIANCQFLPQFLPGREWKRPDL